MQWSGATAPDVMDIGAGTGLSAAVWAGHAATVTAIEPSAGMRAVAISRVAEMRATGETTEFTVTDAPAERTGLPAGCADIVTASQAMHWFDADREQGDAARLVAVALSQGGAVALLAAGATEDEMGLAALREVAAGRLPWPRTWWRTYRIRLAVR
jgi:SAM-dependent methyltransferase